MAQNKKSNSQNQHHEDLDKDLLQEIWGAKSAVKIYQALEIGKIRFSFFEKEDPKNSIDVYMDAVDFVSDFIALVPSGELEKRLAFEKQRMKNESLQYGNNLWESRAGIAGNDKEQIRKFSIQPGAKTQFAFRATQNKKSITIGFDMRELKNLAYKWSFLEKDWNKMMSEQYCLSNMTSEYTARKKREQYEAQQREEEELPINEAETVAASTKIPSRIEESADDDLPVSMPTQSQITSGKKENDVRNEKTEPEETSKQEPKPSVPSLPMKSIVLKVKTPLTDASGGRKAFQGWAEDNSVYSVIIRKELIDNDTPKLKKMMSDASKAGTKLTVFGGVKDKIIYVA